MNSLDPEAGRLLDRDLSKAITEPVRKLGGPPLREIVDQGLAAFERCSTVAGGSDENLGILFPFLHCIEMLDGTEVLLDTGAVAPALVTTRAAFESLLALEYVTKENTTNRGAAYAVTEIHARLRGSERFDPTTQAGQRLRKALSEDQWVQETRLPMMSNSAEYRDSMRQVLTKPHLSKAAEEYERVRAKAKKHPDFSALWDGPRNLEQLAAAVKRSGQYEVLYRHWSRSAHGRDLERQLRSEDDSPEVARLRDGEGLAQAYSLAISFGLDAIRTLLGHYRPLELESFYPRWYFEKIRAGYLGLSPYYTGEDRSRSK